MNTLASGNADLLTVIRAAIVAAGGRITFADFMALALQHPAYGYYATGRGAPGREGADFLTAPETSPYFGRCLAVQAAECWHRLGSPPQWAIWEPGAGAGTLARTLLDALRYDDPAAYAAVTYWLDDISPLARDRATAALVPHAARVQWGSPPPGFAGLLLTNEFADALPVHRVRMDGGAFHEQYVRWEGSSGALADEWDIPTTPAVAASLKDGGITLADGQIAEVSLAAAEWLRDAAARLGAGYVVTIDYGDEAAALYRPGRFPDGSLMCYRAHTANREPFAAVGEQDMTTHVDFTALMRAGMAAGLTTLGLTTQASFLVSLGLGEMLYAATQQGNGAGDAVTYMMQRNAVVRLIEPGAMGRNRVLLQGKNVAATPPLRGLAEQPI